MFVPAYVHIPTLWERMLEASPLVKGGYLLLFIAAILILVAVLRSSERRGPSRALFLVALVLAGAAYLILDFGYISLNLRMRDPEGVRQACRQLLRARLSSEPGDYDVPEAEIPEALRKLGASYVEVRRSGCVRIGFTHTGLTDFWCYAYVPAGATPPPHMQRRRTFFNEIYAARIIRE
ncbi:MAG TPA: hypothetical protein VGO11_15080 [Chthoniobacteraceae bacterium]|jgi:hypothetical protein|nr:hypothetical protein [Chthoniobacteraceae bacterium]